MKREGKRFSQTGKNNARQSLGRTGERLAVEKLTLAGYCILERNFRCRLGEIDIVAIHEQDLVFIEVKTRRGVAYGWPEEAVTARKLHTIVNVAALYRELHVCFDRNWRIDVVAIQLSSVGHLEQIRVYRHVSVE